MIFGKVRGGFKQFVGKWNEKIMQIFHEHFEAPLYSFFQTQVVESFQYLALNVLTILSRIQVLKKNTFTFVSLQIRGQKPHLHNL